MTGNISDKSSKPEERQNALLAFIEANGPSSIGQVFEYAQKNFGKITRLTIFRDLDKLRELSLIERQGKSRRTAIYRLSPQYSVFKKIDVEKYFSFPFSERKANPLFNDAVFSILGDNLFLEEELERLNYANEKYIQTKNELSKKSPAILRKEWQRLIIELSWKSSEIEGNTYTLLETEALLREMRFAKGKDKAEAQMILNHKKALDFILTNKDYFKNINLEKIKKIHELLTENMDIKKDFRDHPVGITGTIYRPLPKKKDIDTAMKKLVEALSKISNPLVKAFTVLIMIAYIQPFEDGNKRTSRIIANAILYANDKAMLSYRNVDAVEYKKAMVLFYEKNNINYIKEIFIAQFEFAVNNYF